MLFPYDQLPWVEALIFLRENSRTGEIILAPAEFGGESPFFRTYGDGLKTPGMVYPWIVVHQERLHRIHGSWLGELAASGHAVFANELFVIFSGNKALAPVNPDSHQLISFREKLSRLQPPLLPSPVESQGAKFVAEGAIRENTMEMRLREMEGAVVELRREIRQSKETHEKLLAGYADSIRHLTSRLAVFSNHAAALEGASPKLSVIIPVYNRASLVPEAIRSVFGQDYQNRELIVVDDGSDDGLEAALQIFRDDPSLKILRIPHGGASKARNAGLEAASGEVIVYLDSDNIMYPGYLGAVAGAFAAKPEMMCSYAAELLDKGGMQVRLRQDAFDWSAFFERKIGLDMNVFAHRRKLYEKLGGFDESLMRHTDFDLVLRYTREHPPGSIPAIAVHYRAGPWPRINSSGEFSKPTMHRVLAKHLPRISGALRVLVVAHDGPQLSGSPVDSEIRWMLGRGVDVEAYAAVDPGAFGKSSAFGDAVRAFKPDILHFHGLSLFARHQKEAKEFKIPVTIRAGAGEVDGPLLKECVDASEVKFVYLPPFDFVRHSRETAKLKPLGAGFDTSRFYPRLGRDLRLVVRAGSCVPGHALEEFFRIAALRPEYKFVLALARSASSSGLPEKLAGLNKSLGSPVDIRLDVQYSEMADLTARAGIYLHTSASNEPFGMPISLAESMGCGAVPLARDCPASRAFLGTVAEYYTTHEEASGILKKMLDWPRSEWNAHADASARHAYRNGADVAVLPHLLADWQAICGSLTPRDKERFASSLFDGVEYFATRRPNSSSILQ